MESHENQTDSARETEEVEKAEGEMEETLEQMEEKQDAVEEEAQENRPDPDTTADSPM